MIVMVLTFRKDNINAPNINTPSDLCRSGCYDTISVLFRYLFVVQFPYSLAIKGTIISPLALEWCKSYRRGE